MSVYVDDLWYRPRGSRLTYSCHLMADTQEELEAFARKIGLRKGWRHGDHYDLTAQRRARAIEAGAVIISTREMVQRRRILGR